MTQLSEHFSFNEMTKTSVRASNEPDIQAMENLRVLCNKVMEPCRELVGPILVTSGYRSFHVNMVIGGSRTSQHCRGQACDWVPMAMDIKGAFLYVMGSDIPYDQLILECPNGLGRGWIHISHNNLTEKQRGEVLMCIRPGRFEPFDRKVFDELR